MIESPFAHLSRLVVLAALLWVTSPAQACQVCFPLPKKSIADFLMESEAVLLAREDPERPFHYRSIQVLKGAAPDKPLDLFLDSGTRRILQARPRCSILLAKRGKWERLAMVDEGVRTVVDDVLRSKEEWKRDEAARFAYFAKLFGHEDPVLRNLAHLEVARAPYSAIRRMGRDVPRAKIHAALADSRYMEWWALHILLLAQSEDARDRKLIVDTVRSLAKFSQPLHLSAWATAYIEIAGDGGIEFFETHYFRRARRLEELREVVLALSVQGKNGSAERRDRVAASYKVLLARHPALASAVLDDLIAWERKDMVPFMQAFGAKHVRSLAPDARLKLRRFVALRE